MNQKLHILVVEDDANVRELLGDFLSDEYTVYAAVDGKHALEILNEKSNEVDIVLTDIKMPELDGFKLTSIIKEKYPSIGVIIISGSENTDYAIEAIRRGAYDYILKPIKSQVELELIIKRWKYQQSLEVKLEEYTVLHKELMDNMKVRTFMSVDVAESLSLKRGEDPILVQSAFQNYQKLVKQCVEEHGGYIHDTSGDGAMAVFTNPTGSVEASRSLLREVRIFNSKKNVLSKNFTVRIGIHTGPVIQYGAGDISQMFSHSLDTAGHIQKLAQAGTIQISEATLEVLDDTQNFSRTELTGNGFNVYKSQ